MERKLPLVQPEFNAGEALLPLMETDEAFINGMYEGMSYQSLLSLSLDHSYYGEVKPFSSAHSSFNPSLVNDMLCASSTASSQIQQSSASFRDFSTGDHFAWLNKKTEINPDADQKLKFPKLEPVTDNLQLYPYNNEVFLSEPFNYFSNTSGGFGYHSLPDLRCLEEPNYLDFSSSLVTTENRVVEPVRPVSQVMSNLLKNRQPYSSSTTRMRRQKLSEKTRCLEKLLPWDKKMDTATMLEEAYKYVKFLQAQISVLQSMPPLVEGGTTSSSYSDQDRNRSNEAKAISVFGTLAKLNRQQLLQVLLNSPVAQTYLYSKGCCVYSVEQLVQYRKIAQRNALYRQSLFFSGMLF